MDIIYQLMRLRHSRDNILLRSFYYFFLFIYLSIYLLINISLIIVKFPARGHSLDSIFARAATENGECGNLCVNRTYGMFLTLTLTLNTLFPPILLLGRLLKNQEILLV